MRFLLSMANIVEVPHLKASDVISCVLHFSTLRGDNFARFRINTKYWECVDSINYYLDSIQNTGESGKQLKCCSTWLCCAVSLSLDSFMQIYGGGQ